MDIGQHTAMYIGQHTAMDIGQHTAMDIGQHTAMDIGQHTAMDITTSYEYCTTTSYEYCTTTSYEYCLPARNHVSNCDQGHRALGQRYGAAAAATSLQTYPSTPRPPSCSLIKRRVRHKHEPSALIRVASCASPHVRRLMPTYQKAQHPYISCWYDRRVSR